MTNSERHSRWRHPARTPISPPVSLTLAGLTGSWSVPWPVDASFNQVVRHFLRTYVGGLQGERCTARQLAYWEAYQAALKVASTDELTGPGAWHWHDDMVRCVDDCVAIFRDKAQAEGLSTTTNGQQMATTPVGANSCPTCRRRLS